MSSVERDLKLLKQKIDLLLDGYQVLFLKLEQQARVLQHMEAHQLAHAERHNGLHLEPEVGPEDRKVLRMSEKFLMRVNQQNRPDPDFDPDDKTLA